MYLGQFIDLLCWATIIAIFGGVAVRFIKHEYLAPPKESPIILSGEVIMKNGHKTAHLQWHDVWIPVLGAGVYFIKRRERTWFGFPHTIGSTDLHSFVDPSLDPTKSYEYWIECGKDAKKTYRRSNGLKLS